MAERVALVAEPRTVLGKQVNQLRRQGRLPANVYGRGLESVAIEIDARDFQRTIKAHGVRAMFELRINGETQTRHVILRGLDRKGGTGDPIHADFFQVDLNRPISANVPLHLVGDAPAVRDLAGTLLQSLEYVAIHCLPLAIPDSIEVDVAPLKGFDVSLTVADVKPPEGVEITTDPAIVVATVTPPRLRTEAEEEAEAAAAEEGEAPAEEAAEGGEAKTEAAEE
ncbi:MAG TPA: 50S ribosomal protein L25 [Tepidiformaceae bacterium]|nr:50S ribosomal protein L25 [Tepidiformaceae bacterium]